MNRFAREFRADIRKNITTMIACQCFGAPLPQTLVNGGVFALLIITLGGSKFEVGTVFMLNFLGQTIRVLAAPHADVKNRKRMFRRWALISNILFLGIFLVPPVRSMWGNEAAIWFACGVYFAQRVAINIGATAWQPMVAETVPSALRGRFTGSMRRAFQLISLLVIVLTGIYLGDEPSLARFNVVFAVLVALSFLRPLLLSRLPDPGTTPGVRIEPLARNFIRPFRDRKFRRFLVFWGCAVFATNLGRPFIVPFLKQDLDFPSSMTVYASALLVLGMALSLLRWGRVADRLGNRLVFLVNIVLMAVAFVLLAFIPHYGQSPVMATILSAAALLTVGVAVGGQGIAHTVRIMHAAPDRYRGSYMSAFFVVNGVIAGLTSSAAGLVLDLLPTYVRVGTSDLLLMRIHFPIVASLVVIPLLILRRVQPLAEGSIRESLSIFIESLPSVISLPMQAVRAGFRKYPEDCGSHNSGREPPRY